MVNLSFTQQYQLTLRSGPAFEYKLFFHLADNFQRWRLKTEATKLSHTILHLHNYQTLDIFITRNTGGEFKYLDKKVQRKQR